MKVGIISDTHDNLENLKKFFNFCKKEKINLLIHCGDICRGETLKEIENNFEKVFLTFGNSDIRESFVDEFKNTEIFEKEGKINLGGLKIGFCHTFDLKEKKPILKNFDFFFFGHTHWPFLKKEGNCFLANPGNLAGLFWRASFAILEIETKTLELKILEKV